ncbi:hypothetical protein A4A49_49324, partial [Nicotiana attenuata]
MATKERNTTNTDNINEKEQPTGKETTTQWVNRAFGRNDENDGIHTGKWVNRKKFNGNESAANNEIQCDDLASNVQLGKLWSNQVEEFSEEEEGEFQGDDDQEHDVEEGDHSVDNEARMLPEEEEEDQINVDDVTNVNKEDAAASLDNNIIQKKG